MALTRARLRELLDHQDRPAALISRTVEPRDGYVLERLLLKIGLAEVRGLLTRPDRPGRHPAILYGHSHGGLYHLGADELLIGREYLLEPYGPVLARAGYVSLCIDMPVFGARADLKESFESKKLIWFGRSLIGEMLSDHGAALTYLAAREDVDRERIGALGMSMGCTLTYALAAMDERIAAAAHICCYADLRTLIELGEHDGHGIYLSVPGLLNETDVGEIAGLIAPRPQLICVGEADHLTPTLAIDRAWAMTEVAYASTGGKIDLIREPGVAHQETRRMREAVLAFFQEELA
jgi:dienelactone hydrolase